MENLSYKNLKKFRYFSSLSDGALETIAKRLTVVELPAGTKIIKEKTPADSFYLLSRGEVVVSKRTKTGQAAQIAVSGSGDSFGEMALLTCSPRCCTVTARTDVLLYRLDKSDFEEIISLEAAFNNMLEGKAKCYAEYDKLKTLQPFALLDNEKVLSLIEKMREETFAPGVDIIKQGDKGTVYYIIKSGRAAVIRQEKGKEPEQVAVIGTGDGFGEEALIREKPRSATVRTLDETTVLVLDKTDFDRVLGASFIEWEFPEDIPKDKMGEYVFIDARIPAEYEQEHIRDAINIPIEVLRQKYAELDPSQEYYTYCISDSRGAAAAFLMKSQGFKVKGIRGGLSAWDGPVQHNSDGIHYPSEE